MISREAEIVDNTPKITPEEAVKMRYPSYNHNRYGVVSIIGPTPDGTCYVKIQNSFPTEREAREDAQQAVQKGYIHFDLYVIDLQTFFQVPAPKEEEQKIKEVTNMDPRLNKYLSRQKLEQEKQLENIKHRMKCKKKKTVYAKYEEFVLSQANMKSLIEGASHHMGGLRYSNNKNFSNVDKNLRIRGLRHIYVCSSAIFPTSGSVNPTMTICALSNRLAEHLNK